MADDAKITKNTQSADRRRRLAAELRANLGKRKEQARAAPVPRQSVRRCTRERIIRNEKDAERFFACLVT